MSEPSVLAERYLHYQDGGSNKGYVSLVLASGAAWRHTTRWGGLGKSFQTKELAHESEAGAMAAHEKVVKEKTAKGYRDCDPALLGFTSVLGGTVPAGPAQAVREREWIPMLFVECDSERAMALLEDPHYLAQRKMNGERRRLVCVNGEVTGYNRRGLRVPVPGGLTEAMRILSEQVGAVDLDGEVIGNDQFWAFDWLGKAEQAWPARERLAQLILDAQYFPEGIFLVPTGRLLPEKLDLYEQAKAACWEGLVFKHKEQPYFPGRSNTNFKWKQWHSATVILTRVNRTARLEYGSFRMEVYDKNGTRVPIGNVSGGFSQVERQRMGALMQDGQERLAEVRYLYFAQAALFEATYLHEREDVTEEDLLRQPLYGEDGRRIDL